MSALDLGRAKHIPSRFQRIVNGYLRISQSLLTNNNDSISIIPSIIFHICLLFYYDFDKWDSNAMGIDLMFDETNANIVRYKGREYRQTYNSAYLRRICNSEEGGIYHWKFRFINLNHIWNLIGIWKVTEDKEPETHYFTQGRDAAYALCVSDGKLVDRSHGGDSSKQYSCVCDNGDILEMYLDFETMELRYTINDQDYGKAFDVDPGKYRAAICLHQPKGAIELLRE